MGNPRQKRRQRPAKCKPRVTASPADSAEPTTDGPAFERPWMAGFLADAMATADVPGAMSRANLGFGDYLRARRVHPVFGQACVELDQVVRQALYITLEALAASGDAKAIRLLNGGIDRIKASLLEMGIVPDAGPKPRPRSSDGIPKVRLGRYLFPKGPCAACARGLDVYWHNPTTDQGQHVLVRHHLAEWLMIPLPQGKESMPTMLGYDPNDPRGNNCDPSEPWDPRQVLPEFTGSTRKEMIAEAKRRGNWWPDEASKDDDPIKRTESRGELAQEISVAPLPEHADCYTKGIAPNGNEPLWRLKTEFYGVVFEFGEFAREDLYGV